MPDLKTFFLPLGLENVLSLATEDTSPGGRGNTLRVVELGAGMAGIGGLALAAAADAGLSSGIHVEVLLTDGHPFCVENNRINSLLTLSAHQNVASKIDDGFNPEIRSEVKCRLLRWANNSYGAEECALMTSRNRRSFDLCLVSDCTHFQDFHSALMATIGRLLRVGGVCILCQPHRGSSLNSFIKMLQKVNERCDEERQRPEPLFNIMLLEKYNERVWNMHKSFLSENENRPEEDTFSSGLGIPPYDPNIHYPHLLFLRKNRIYDEALDTAVMVQHQEDRGLSP